MSYTEAGNFRSSKEILAEANKYVLLDVPEYDPIWGVLRGVDFSDSTGAMLDFDLSKRRIWKGSDHTLKSLDNNLFPPIERGAVHRICIWGKGSESKDYCGDAITLKSKIDTKVGTWRYQIEDKDGVTEMPKDSEDRSALIDRLRPLIPHIENLHPDQIANTAIQAIERLGLISNLADIYHLRIAGQNLPQYDHPFIHSLSTEEIVRALNSPDAIYSQITGSVEHLSRQYLGAHHPSVIKWIHNNLALGLAYGRFRDDANPRAIYPGTTGGILVVEEETPVHLSRIFSSALADTVEATVFSSGQIEFTSISTNSLHDRKTVLKIRDLMESDSRVDLNQAREILRQKGHFDESFQAKRLEGNVAVCDGSDRFMEQTLSSYPNFGIARHTVAKVLFSDGMLAPFIPLVGARDDQGLISAVEKALTGDPTLTTWVQAQESITLFDENGLPTREKESDDHSCVSTMFADEKTVDELLSQGLFLNN